SAGRKFKRLSGIDLKTMEYLWPNYISIKDWTRSLFNELENYESNSRAFTVKSSHSSKRSSHSPSLKYIPSSRSSRYISFSDNRSDRHVDSRSYRDSRSSRDS